jgi:hypothetical protein
VGPGGGRPTKFYVSLACGFVHTCLHKKGNAKEVEKVGGGMDEPQLFHIFTY